MMFTGTSSLVHRCYCTKRPLLLAAQSITTVFIGNLAANYSMMRVVHQDRFGSADELRILNDASVPQPKSNEVLVKVVATALNRADLLMREGKYPNMKTPVALGLEVAGVVQGVGSECDKWKKDDRVMALLPGGGYAEFVTVNKDHVMRIPANLNFHEAAAIPEVWLTAYQLLHFVGKTQSNETVLIHGGGSGVGTAAVQLARLANVTAIVTAGSDEKIAAACKLGAAAGFNYKEGPFMEKVLDFTAGKGVNVVLDCVGGSYWKQNIGCLAFDGRWVVFGLLGGGNVDGSLLSQVLGKRISILGTTLKARNDEYKAKLVRQFTENALGHFSGDSSCLVPVIDRVMKFDQIVDAHQYMATNKNVGKIVIDVQEA